MIDLASLRQQFRDRNGVEPRVFRAPGRVNLIGEHTDYNDGFVMPAAIGFATCVAAAARTDRTVHVYSNNVHAAHEFSLDNPGQPAHHWSDYVVGVAAMLLREGVPLAGANLLIDSDVPLGAGLSSSAALEVSIAHALLGIAGQSLDPLRVAKICQRAEHEYPGTRCGIMDQFVSCFGVEGRAIMIDCRTLDHWALPLPGDASLVVCNTMVKHELAGSQYNLRRADCEEGARTLGVPALRDASLNQLEQHANQIHERVFRRCRHIISENTRVGQAADALREGDHVTFGYLMNASHHSLQYDFEVSCTELDTMVEIARNQPGVFGARMTGGGFGGCTINLVRTEATPAFIDNVAAAYREATGITPSIYVCQAVAGASEVVT